MPAIRNSTDLVNKYNEILEFCQNYREPIFLTNNGQGQLAVMSIDAYEELASRYKLYDAINIGLDQIKNGEIIPGKEMMEKIKKYAGI